MGFQSRVKHFFAPVLWGNLLAMALVVVCLLFGVIYWLDYYTRHGQTVRVPDVKQKTEQAAFQLLEEAGLQPEVRDTGYVAGLPAGIILDQSEPAGKEVKPGRVVFLTINSGHARLVTFPDIADNSSLREAQVRLQAMGFSLAPIRYTHGEKDWVYEVRVNGRSVRVGERVPSNATVTLFVGNGYDDVSDSLWGSYVDTANYTTDPTTEDPQPITTPPSTKTTPTTATSTPAPKTQPKGKAADVATGYEF